MLSALAREKDELADELVDDADERDDRIPIVKRILLKPYLSYYFIVLLIYHLCSLELDSDSAELNSQDNRQTVC